MIISEKCDFKSILPNWHILQENVKLFSNVKFKFNSYYMKLHGGSQGLQV